MKFLFVTHQLSLTGAPMVLMDVIRFLHTDGNHIYVISMSDGPLREDLEEMGIEIFICENVFDCWSKVILESKDYDVVFANTLLTFGVITILNHSKIPVFWWIHEPKEYFDEYQGLLPNFSELGDNVHILAVSPILADIILDRYGVSVTIFPFGVGDIAKKDKSKTSERVRFYTIAHFSFSKGQDVLAAAISRLEKTFLEQCEFHFYGDLNDCDEEYLNPLKTLQEYGYPVFLHNLIPHQDILTELGTADALIVPSRIEPMPTVAAEAMMQSVPVLISDACGISRYMSNDGVLRDWIFPSEDVDALQNKIKAVVAMRHTDEFTNAAKKFRRLYEKRFSLSGQRENFYKMLGDDLRSQNV